ncbi:MAG TPA: hypothetical protein PK826_12375 [Anaerolineae bacterium]|nr:hypothetical protein [Anaerolineae bacterium]
MAILTILIFPGGGRRRTTAAALVAALLLAACGGSPDDDAAQTGAAQTGAAPATPPATANPVERSVVVDRPAGGAASPPGGATAATAPARPGIEPPTLDPLSADPLTDAAVFATATADAAAALAAGGGLVSPTTPATAADGAGTVITLNPLPCAALTLDSTELKPDCAAELLQSGRLDGRELMALVGFDLAALPAGAELLYAGLELVTADQRFARPASAWHVEAVDLSAPSFSRLLAALPLSADMVWRVAAPELAPGRRLTLELSAEARAFLAGRVAEGRGKLAFRIQLVGAAGGLAAWQARGERGPRLRLAYLNPATPASGEAEGVVDWQLPPPAPATQAAP